MDLNSLPKNASSLKFTKHDSNVMSLCLTCKVNLGLSLRKTASVCIKPFVDNYDYGTGRVFTVDETYIKIRGIKTYIWFIMDAAKRSIIGYQVSDNRGVDPCIPTMRMAFRHLKKLPENFRFIADGYSAYPLAAQQFFHEFGDKFKFEITQVISLTNDDEVSKEFRPYKQMFEHLNRTYKASYRKTNGFDNIDGANYDLALWVAYYNFLRPHKHNKFMPLDEIEMLPQTDTMPGKWQLRIFLGQQTILNLQHGEATNCSQIPSQRQKPTTAKRHALDGTKKNCYTAVNDGKFKLFLSSSPSLIHLQQFFFVLSRVAVSCNNIKYLQFSRFI